MIPHPIIIPSDSPRLIREATCFYPSYPSCPRAYQLLYSPSAFQVNDSSFQNPSSVPPVYLHTCQIGIYDEAVMNRYAYQKLY